MGSRPEWCISSIIYSGDVPFWSETLDVLETVHGAVRRLSKSRIVPLNAIIIIIIIININSISRFWPDLVLHWRPQVGDLSTVICESPHQTGQNVKIRFNPFCLLNHFLKIIQSCEHHQMLEVLQLPLVPSPQLLCLA